MVGPCAVHTFMQLQQSLLQACCSVWWCQCLWPSSWLYQSKSINWQSKVRVHLVTNILYSHYSISHYILYNKFMDALPIALLDELLHIFLPNVAIVCCCSENTNCGLTEDHCARGWDGDKPHLLISDSSGAGEGESGGEAWWCAGGLCYGIHINLRDVELFHV